MQRNRVAGIIMGMLIMGTTLLKAQVRMSSLAHAHAHVHTRTRARAHAQTHIHMLARRHGRCCSCCRY